MIDYPILFFTAVYMKHILNLNIQQCDTSLFLNFDIVVDSNHKLHIDILSLSHQMVC